jgi:hypothetical protein
MAKLTCTTKKRPAESDGRQRANHPPVGLVAAGNDAVEGRKKYASNPHIAPAIPTCYGVVSPAFKPGKHNRTGFKIADNRGIGGLEAIPGE